jgi:hypothetical protein
MIRKAKDIATRAITTLPSERSLDDARYAVIGALSNLLQGPLSQGKIAEAKASIEGLDETLRNSFYYRLSPLGVTKELSTLAIAIVKGAASDRSSAIQSIANARCSPSLATCRKQIPTW